MMAPLDEDQIDQLVQQAFALPKHEWDGYLRNLRHEYPASVCETVAKLLDADRRLRSDDQYFSSCPFNVSEVIGHSNPRDPLIGAIVGDYEISQKLDDGGSSDVYLAYRREPYEMPAAIKVFRWDGLDREDRLRRFEAERQILADLDHTNIARILGGGSLPDGRPYLIVEHVDGRPITEHCNTFQLDLRERLRLFQVACAAVSHAHSREVIHRDIKPANILVTSDGNVKLLDFGVAKLTQQAKERIPLATTRLHRLPLTREYASPEQLMAQPVTIASDVYSLGVVLYELLCNQLPIPLDGLSPREIEDRVLETTPPQPSHVVRRAADSSGWISSANRHRISRQLRGDLDRIVMMALRKNPERRYRSPTDLADDINRYFDGFPVRAHPERFSYQAIKFARRHAVMLAAACLVMASLMGAAIISGISSHHANSAAEQAQRQLTVARGTLYNLRLHEASELSRRYPALAKDHLENDSFFPVSDREITWGLLYGVARRDVASVAAHAGAVRGIAISSDGSLLASSGMDGSILLWDSSDLQKLATLHQSDSPVTAIAYSSDDRYFAAVGMDGDLRIWDPSNQSLVFSVQTRMGTPTALTFSFDSHQMAIGTTSGNITLFTLGPRIQRTAQLTTKTSIVSLEFSPSKPLLAAATTGGSVVIWDTESNTSTSEVNLSEECLNSLAWSPSGRRLAVSRKEDAGVDLLTIVSNAGVFQRQPEQVTLHDVPDGVHRRPVTGLSFSFDGRRLVCADADGRVVLWDLAWLEPTLHLVGHRVPVRTVASSRDGDFLYAGDQNGGITKWRISDSTESTRFAVSESPVFALSNAGELLVAGDRKGKAHILNRSSGDLHLSWQAHEDAVRSLAISPDGKHIATASYDASVKLWDFEGKETKGFHGHKHRVQCVKFIENGQRVVSGSRDNTVRVWDVESGECIRVFRGHTRRVTSLAYSPQQNLFFSGGFDGIVQAYDARHLKELQAIEVGHAIGSMEVSPSGSLLAVGPARNVESQPCPGTILIYEIRGFRRVARLDGHSDEVLGLNFSDDGRSLASASADGTARIWDHVLGQQRAKFETSKAFAVLLDESALSVGCGDGQIRYWPSAYSRRATLSDDTTFGNSTVNPRFDVDCEVIAELLGHRETVTSYAFVGKGPRVVTLQGDGLLTYWDAATGEPLRRHTTFPVPNLVSTSGTHVTAGQLGNNLVHIFDEEMDSIQPIRLTHPVRHLSSGCVAGTIIAVMQGGVASWDLANGQEIWSTELPNTRYSATARNANRVIIGQSDDAGKNRLTLVNSNTLAVVKTIDLQLSDIIIACAISPNGQLCAVSSRDIDHRLQIVDLNAGKVIQRLQGHIDIPICVGFVGDGNVLASLASNHERRIRFWDVASGVEIGSVPGSSSMALSSDGRRIATTKDDSIARIYEIDVRERN